MRGLPTRHQVLRDDPLGSTLIQLSHAHAPLDRHRMRHPVLAADGDGAVKRSPGPQESNHDQLSAALYIYIYPYSNLSHNYMMRVICGCVHLKAA